MSDIDVKGLARKAAEELVRRGWYQGSLASAPWGDAEALATCSVCALGAIRTAITGSPIASLGNTPEGMRDYYALSTAVADALNPEWTAESLYEDAPSPEDEDWRPRWEEPDDYVAHYNDSEAKSVDPILAAFNKVAAG